MKRMEIGVGAFILMGFACALALAFASTDLKNRLGGERYAVTARFSNLGELKVNAPIKIAGVKVGEVGGIALDPGRYDAIVTLNLQRSAGELPTDTSAAIYTSGLLGERYIGLTPGGDPEVLGAGDEIVFTQSAVVLEQLIGKYMFGSADKKPGAETGDASATPPVASDAPAEPPAPAAAPKQE
jgi:phospholipid/cholesterol/gamma-HCH transport system substrate-binding protein